MGLLEGLRRWWNRRGGSDAEGGDGDAADASGSGGDGDAGPAASPAQSADYECAICGTAVEGPESTCPVCHSEDVVRADGRDSTADTEQPTPNRHVEESDDTAERLQQVRNSSEILEAHDDRWTEIDADADGDGDAGAGVDSDADAHAGFRVETPDGEVTVASRVEVAALLEEHYK
jgi:hypothetical protein